MKTFKQRIVFFSGSTLILFIFFTSSAFTQDIIPNDTLKTSHSNKEASQKKRSFKMTTLTFGGNGINVTKINNKFSVMTGGRGSATFNNRYTIGGGGWGMTKGVEIETNTEGTYNFVKMGYGGIDFGYLVFPGEKCNIGTKLLIGGCAVFKETIPESKDNGFKMFPVLEPTIYCQISLSKLFRLEIGASYRYIRGTNLPYISERNLSGFSCSIGFLVSACTCN
jgi:hypothetical protein